MFPEEMVKRKRNQKKGSRPKQKPKTQKSIIPQRQQTASLISLGCAKNLTLSEEIIARLGLDDYVITPQPRGADLVIINTCGFIEDARDESRDFITQMEKYRRIGVIGFLVVYGCMVQGFLGELQERYRDVDLWVGSETPDKLIALLREKTVGSWLPIRWAKPTGAYQPRLFLTPPSYSYLRISDGCSNCCNYCSIPRLRGPLRSRPMSIVMKEAKESIKSGRSELVLIGQDLASYGVDRGRQELPNLIQKLSAIEELEWIRLLYIHPRHLTDAIIDIFSKFEKVVPYIDLPVQHLSDKVLKLMGRKVTYEQMFSRIQKLRTVCPEIAIRTTIIVGHPGETEEEFQILIERLKKCDFSHIGVFTYSPEPKTPSSKLPDDVSEKEKDRRRDIIMQMAQESAFNRNKSRIGHTYSVLIDSVKEIDGELFSCGRTPFEAPEVDGIMLLSPAVDPGSFGEAIITDSNEYDLFGEINFVFEEEEIEEFDYEDC